MYVVNAQTMRSIDEEMISHHGISSIELMNQAAQAIFKRIDRWDLKHQRILIVCGCGNNAGDGFALSVLLKKAGYHHVALFCICEESQLSKDARYYYQCAKEQKILMYDGISSLRHIIMYYDVCIDAIFGTGLSRDVEGVFSEVIALINASHIPCISLDIPSGICSDTGVVKNVAIEADVTIVLDALKFGEVVLPGKKYCGKIFVEDIGIKKCLYERKESLLYMNHKQAKHMLYSRKEESNKASFGKVLFIGGSQAMIGASALCAKAMLRSGVGTLTMFVPECIVFPLSIQIQECMFIAAKQEQGFFAKEALEQLQACIHQYDLIVIGNGMGRSLVSEDIVRFVLQQEIPCILDGDAIYECAKCMDLVKNRNVDTMFTPHPKELSYMMHCSLEQIKQQPLAFVTKFSQQYPQASLLYKDYYSVVVTAKESSIMSYGSNALAKGGSGDVLCGIVAGLYAQSKQSFTSLSVASYVHACCALELLQSEDANSILPSDLIEQLSHVYKKLR